jgi:hypothetical protein
MSNRKRSSGKMRLLTEGPRASHGLWLAGRVSPVGREHGALDKLAQQLGHSYPQRSSGSRVGGASRAILGNGANSRSGSVSRPSVSDHASHKSDHCRQARSSWSDERCAASRHSAALFVQSATLIIVATSQNLQTLDIFTPSACRTKRHRGFPQPERITRNQNNRLCRPSTSGRSKMRATLLPERQKTERSHDYRGVAPAGLAAASPP